MKKHLKILVLCNLYISKERQEMILFLYLYAYVYKLLYPIILDDNRCQE